MASWTACNIFQGFLQWVIFGVTKNLKELKEQIRKGANSKGGQRQRAVGGFRDFSEWVTVPL